MNFNFSTLSTSFKVHLFLLVESLHPQLSSITDDNTRGFTVRKTLGHSSNICKIEKYVWAINMKINIVEGGLQLLLDLLKGRSHIPGAPLPPARI